jgi:hypothetical protein
MTLSLDGTRRLGGIAEISTPSKSQIESVTLEHRHFVILRMSRIVLLCGLCGRMVACYA